MQIRQACAADAPKLDALLTQLIRDEAQYDGNLDETCVVRENYASRIGLEGHRLWLAEEDGEIAGYAYGFIFDVPGITRAPAALLDALFVTEKYRRQGVATALFAQFRAFALESGACRMELKVLSQNRAALAFYENLGFAETKKYMELEMSRA